MLVDPRGQRLAAVITSVVLAAALVLLESRAGIALVAFQAAVFLLGATLGPSRTPYGWLYARLVRPRLGAARELEDARGPRFAQGVGATFAVIALGGLLVGASGVAAVAVGFALAAALLNASVGFCLGCELYLILRRIAPAQT
ncbi:UNVERIFIED_CONTAM: membrane protein [Mumia flava]